MKTSMILLAALLISCSAYGQAMLLPISDADPVVASASSTNSSDHALIVRQMAYPIPTYDFVTLELEGKANTSVRIRVEDAGGNEVYELFKVVDLDPDYVGRIDMRDQEKAVFFVIVETPEGDELSRMEIEKR